MKIDIISRGITQQTKISLISSFPLLAIIASLIVGGLLGLYGTYALVVVLGILVMVPIIILRQDELAATIIIVVHIYIDFYVGLAFVADLMTLGLLLIFFLTSSSRYPWTEPPAMWLWVVFLILAIIPATRGLSFLDSADYYFNIIFYPFILFWLGIVLARDIANIRRLFKWLTIIGTLLAVITLTQVLTGKLLFTSTFFDAAANTAAAAIQNFNLSGTDVSRAGSYLLNPDSNGTFFAVLLLISLGVFIESSRFLEKIFYAAAILLILLALLATYSTGAWLGALAGVVSYLILVGRHSKRIQITTFLVSTLFIIVTFFPAQVAAQLQHAFGPGAYNIRFAAWQTGIRVILAFPFSGLGIGRDVYFVRAQAYAVPAQYVPLYHPHNSYLELAALGGIPVSLVFIALVLVGFWLALQNWARVDIRNRPLIGGGLAAVIALSANSLVNPGWTLAPLAALGWLILSVISSPLISRKLSAQAIARERPQLGLNELHGEIDGEKA